MYSLNKNFTSIHSILAMAATSVLLCACSKTEVEKNNMSMPLPLVETPIKNASINDTGLEPETVTDVYGNITAVWEEYDGTRFNIWTKRRVAGEDWSMASLLETNNSGDAYSPQVAVDGIGNVTAVWKQSDGKRFSIYANRFVKGVGWEGVKQIEGAAASQVSASAPLVTYNAAGFAIVAWQEADGLNAKTLINHHEGDAGWGEYKLLETASKTTDFPHFGIDGHGLLIVVAQKPEPMPALSSHKNAIRANGYDRVSTYRKPYQ